MPDDLERLTTALADRYRIERELGRGCMATVHLAHDLKHGERRLSPIIGGRDTEWTGGLPSLLSGV